MKNYIEAHIEKIFSFAKEETKERLVKTAVKSLKEESEKLKNILEKGEVKDILESVHKLKGILLNCGLEEIAKEFEEYEFKKFKINEIKKRLKKSLEKIDI